MKRRTFLRGAAAGGAVISVAGSTSTASATASPSPQAGEVFPLFEPLACGAEVGLGWHLHGLSPVRRGARVLRLRHVSGRVAEVHICRRGHRVRGVASTDALDFLLMNDGDGSVDTDEALGRVIKTLARLVAKNEHHLPAGLLAHGQRVSAHGPRGILE